MSSGSIARRYSTALVALCHKHGDCHDVVARDLDRLVGALDKHADVDRALVDRAVPTSVKKKVLASVAKSLVLKPLTRNFLFVLADKQRLSELRAILRDFRERLDELAGRVRATVTTATTLSPLESKRIQAALQKASGKTVILESRTDPTILGGVVTRVGNVVLDGSVRSALTKVRQQLADAVQ